MFLNLTIVDISKTKHKLESQTVERMEYRRDPSSPTKRRKAEDVKVDAKDRKYYLYVRLTHPGVEVWSIETKRTNADGDSTLFRDMITLQLPQTFVDTYGFKLFCRRRQSRNNNSVAVYQSPSSVNQCRYVFIRIVDESNPSSREAMAELLCKVS